MLCQQTVDEYRRQIDPFRYGRIRFETLGKLMLGDVMPDAYIESLKK